VSTRLVIAAAAAVLIVPAGLLTGVAIIAGAAGAMSAGGLTAAVAACTYAYPDADRLADTMAALTAEPVQVTQWDRYAALIGVDADTTAWSDSTREQRDEVLDAAVRNLLYTNTPAAVTTPPIIWWRNTVPDDTDTTWHTTPVPGWDGDLASYLSALLDRYATAPGNDWADHDCTAPAATACAQPTNLDAILATIRHLESGDDYTQHSHSVADDGRNNSGNPTGAYQFLYTTWNRHGGYNEAFLAPPAIQDARASADIDTILDAFAGDVAWVPVAWYVGLGGARNVSNGTWSSAYTPNPAYNTLSIGDYQARWLHHYTTIALPAAGTAPTECPQHGAAAVAWAETQLGAPYAAIDPYRFGTPAWPGGARTGSRGDNYNFPAGTVVYDCSGFVIAAWRHAGVDLVAQYGLYGSQAFPNSPLQEIDPAAIAPGDLAVYSPNSNGVGHIVMIHHIDPDGTVATIEASPSRGVSIGALNWARVTSIKRPHLTTDTSTPVIR